MASVAAHHAEWLSLMDVSGPFLSVPVLKEALPNGLDAHDPLEAAGLRAAMEEWADPTVDVGSESAVDMHLAFVRFVFAEVLGFDDDVLVWAPDVLARYAVTVRAHGAELVPDAAVLDGGELAMVVSVVGPGLRVDEPVPGDAWPASSEQRMVEHLKELGCRLGLVTDGERWTLVSWQEGENPGLATWWSSLWREERVTLQAFRTLVGQHRFVSEAPEDTLAGLLDRSAVDQREVTSKLGDQTLDAVEILIRTIDQIDRDRGGGLLADVDEAELYDAAVTVMMRLIFLFFAEENDLLPTSEPMYVDRYAASTLRSRLQELADEHGEEVLETTHDGWPRLLATWRAVFGGVDHSEMVLAPYGGSLFDPDRYPFLEGRLPGTSWVEVEADPLPIDNRTVLHLLNALQTLEEKGHRRKLSFRALDVEQIGHVYEGMLDHTAARAEGWVLGLSGIGGKEPEIELSMLEGFDDDEALFEFVKGRTGRTAATTRKWLTTAKAGNAVDKFGVRWAPAFSGDGDAADRARRFGKMIREDSTGAPTVFQPGSVYVTDSSHRGATGTHYTPRSLTEEIVRHTLDPLVYLGPAEGKPEDEWDLRSPTEILDLQICDPACGSGAFLVQTCRYLSEKLVEARRVHDDDMTDPTEDDLVAARREVTERCLHGVDINPMACEMAKLSLWLITLAKDLPFTFLDHAIRQGDSLLGIVDVAQLTTLDVEAMDPSSPTHRSLFSLDDLIEDCFAKMRTVQDELRSVPSSDIRDVDRKVELTNRLESIGAGLSALASVVCAARLRSKSRAQYGTRMQALAQFLTAGAYGDSLSMEGTLQLAAEDFARRELGGPVTERMVHWPIWRCRELGEPEFDAVVSNPPFLGGTRIVTEFGDHYSKFLAATFPPARRKADICAYFLRRSCDLTAGTRGNGTVGMVTAAGLTDTSTLPVGLGAVVQAGWQVMRARTGMVWPGAAQVTVNLLWLARDRDGPALLDGRLVEHVSARLTEAHEGYSEPHRLVANAARCFNGSKVWGEGRGFYVSPQQAAEWFKADSRNREVVVPAFTGSDINSNAEIATNRMIINFKEMDEEEAASYGGPFNHLVRTVRDWRIAQDPVRYSRAVKYWWRFFHPRLKLYGGIEDLGLSCVLGRARVCERHLVEFLPVGPVYMEKAVIFLHSDFASFGVIQSGLHAVWWETFGKSRGTSPSYVPTAAYETFPWPDHCDGVSQVSEAFWEARRGVMFDRSWGLTKLATAFEDPSETAQDIQTLRGVGREMNQAVAKAYGFLDLDVELLPLPGAGIENLRLAVPYVERLLGLNAIRDSVGRLR